MDIFIPSLLTKNNLRQLLLSAGKRSFLRDHEVVVSNGWLLYSGFHSYLLKGGVRGGGGGWIPPHSGSQKHIVSRGTNLQKLILDDVTGLQQRLVAYLSNNANIIIF